MITPSRIGNLDPVGRLLTSFAFAGTVASKQFTIDEDTPNGRVELKTGATGLRRRKLLVRARKDGGGTQPTVYIGDSTVSASNGYPLYPEDEIELDVDHTAAVYAFASLGSGQETHLGILEIE